MSSFYPLHLVTHLCYSLREVSVKRNASDSSEPSIAKYSEEIRTEVPMVWCGHSIKSRESLPL